MNIRIPKHLEPRLRAHAARLDLSFNATVNLLLDATLPVGEAKTMDEWLDTSVPVVDASVPVVDASVPAVDVAVIAEPPTLELDKLMLLPFQSFLVTTVPDRRLSISTPHVIVDEKEIELRLETPLWAEVILRGFRVHVLSAVEGASLSVKGPLIRRPGGMLDLYGVPQVFTDDATCTLRQSARVRGVDEIVVRLTATKPMIVAVEALVGLDADTENPWSKSASSSVDTARVPFEIPIKVPLVFEGGVFTGKISPGRFFIAQSMAVPWGTWRVDGVEILACASGRKLLREERYGRGKPAVVVGDLRTLGGANLFASQTGLSWVGFSPGQISPCLRAYPIVYAPNMVQVELSMSTLDKETAESAFVSGYVLGTLLSCTHLLNADEEAHLAAGRLDQVDPTIP